MRPVSNTLALPVLERGRPIASIGLTWFASTMEPAEAVTRYLDDLRELAAAVTLRLAQLERG